LLAYCILTQKLREYNLALSKDRDGSGVMNPPLLPRSKSSTPTCQVSMHPR